jgi:hypothetical protein
VASALEFLGGGAAGGPAAVQAGERRGEIGRLAAVGNWEGAARVCHDWLFDDPVAAWPNAALALIHERCGSLPLARYYAGRALELSSSAGGHPNAAIVGLNRRIRDEWLTAVPPAVPPPLFCKPATTPSAISTGPLSSSSQGPAPANTPSTSAVSAPPPSQPTAAPEATSSPVGTVASATVVPCGDISEERIVTDPRGQWASEASASSAYGTTRYDAMQATGAPNVPSYADHPNAWCPSNSDKGIEWIELTYPKPVHATEVRVRQNYSPGTVVKLEAFALDGTGHTLWEGHDPNTYPPRQTVWLVVRFPRTDFAVQRLKVTLDTRLVRSWNQLDAVQLVGDAP